ncbi:class I SAM-dependent methyltransferase [Leptospira weilii]|nr:class I SAM-dependent methyltransferase [Leptospira weilii]
MIEDVSKFNFETVKIDPFWNLGSERELKAHRIHSYPAKFPAFIATKAFEFARSQNQNLDKVADIFCGCGTTAFEAARSGIDFWGCDINPVATMIAKAKSQKYQTYRLNKYKNEILKQAKSIPFNKVEMINNERLRYWHTKKTLFELSRLKQAIHFCVPENSNYRLFFICAFSNILKASSLWLTKSIKPQLDKTKKTKNILFLYNEQCDFMIQANDESGTLSNSKIDIQTGNFLNENVSFPKVDLVVTSPPYVTSYEYADLHQLSSMWLDFATDYRILRNGSIGSLQHDYNFNSEWKNLNESGTKIVSKLIYQNKRKAKSVAKYFLDMQKVALKSYEILNKKGIAFFVIGNTEYKKVRIDNALHLAQSLNQAGFKKILTSKRKISKKILTPYRDKGGRFTTDSAGRRVYSEEFILIGIKG